MILIPAEARRLGVRNGGTRNSLQLSQIFVVIFVIDARRLRPVSGNSFNFHIEIAPFPAIFLYPEKSKRNCAILLWRRRDIRKGARMADRSTIRHLIRLPCISGPDYPKAAVRRDAVEHQC